MITSIKNISTKAMMVLMLFGNNIAFSQLNTVTFTPSKDAWIKSSTATTNYGSDTLMNAGYSTVGPTTIRILLEFDLSSIPKDAIITEATLTLSRNSGLSSNDQYLYKNTSSWSESTVTWNTAPTYNATDTISVTGGTTATNVSTNVLTHVQDMVCRSNYGWLLAMKSESGSKSVKYYTKESADSAGHWPKLEIKYYPRISIAVNVDPASTASSHDASVDLTVAGGKTPYTYAWADSSGASAGTTQDLTNLYPGWYTLTVTDSLSNNYYAFVVVGSYDEISIRLRPDADFGQDAMLYYSVHYPLAPDYNYATYGYFEDWKWTEMSQDMVRKSVIKFNYFGLPQSTILTSANMLLMGHSHSGAGNGSYLKRITEDWCESCVTWNSQPATTATDQVSLPASTTSTQNYTVDVSTLMKYFLLNPDEYFGYFLELQAPAYYKDMSFYSSDDATSTNRPSLTFTFRIPHQSATLTRIPDGGTYLCKGQKLLFLYDEEYNSTSSALTYNLYQLSNNSIYTQADESVTISYGTNECVLDLGSNGLDLDAGYYLLEVVNAKNEKRYLRFKKTT